LKKQKKTPGPFVIAYLQFVAAYSQFVAAYSQFLDEQTLTVVARLKQIIPEYLGNETRELDGSILDNAHTILCEFIPLIDRRLHDTRCQRLERATGILNNFRLQLFALHAAAKPKGRKPRNPVYAKVIESVTGKLPVQPMRADILTKLKFLLPEAFDGGKCEETGDIGQFKHLELWIRMMITNSDRDLQFRAERAVRRRTAIEYTR
jgi:hypothetical protein